MGRLKVYGGSWDLQEAPVVKSPFCKFLNDDTDSQDNVQTTPAVKPVRSPTTLPPDNVESP